MSDNERTQEIRCPYCGRTFSVESGSCPGYCPGYGSNPVCPGYGYGPGWGYGPVGPGFGYGPGPCPGYGPGYSCPGNPCRPEG